MAAKDAPDGIDRWKPFRFFLESWIGTASGQVGDSSVERTYSLTLANQFIEV